MAEPATAHIVQAELGSQAHTFDVTNACNSFINGIDLARALLIAGRARRALVVTGETPTRAIRWQPSSVEQLRRGIAGYTFGDAGAAVMVEPVVGGGILDIDTETRSEHWDVGGIFGGGSRHPRDLEYTYFEGDGHALKGVFEKIGVSILDRVAEPDRHPARRLREGARPPGDRALPGPLRRADRGSGRARSRSPSPNLGTWPARRLACSWRGCTTGSRPGTGCCSSAWAAGSA